MNRRRIENKKREFWDSLISEAIGEMRPSKTELTPEEDLRLTNSALEKFGLSGRVQKLEEQLATKQHRRMESRLAIPSLREFRSMKSISKRDAADYLCCTTRTISNYARAKKITLTPRKRVAIDDKFVQMLRKVHGDNVLP